MENWGYVRLPFGKHKGRRLCEVEYSYLVWLLHECNTLDPQLREAVEGEVWRRLHSEPEEDAPEEGTAVAGLAELIRRWYRGLCLDYHPDRGGDTKVMQALNDAHERLKQLAGL